MSHNPKAERHNNYYPSLTCPCTISADRFCLPRHHRARVHVVLSSVLWMHAQSFFMTSVPTAKEIFLKVKQHLLYLAGTSRMALSMALDKKSKNIFLFLNKSVKQ